MEPDYVDLLIELLDEVISGDSPISVSMSERIGIAKKKVRYLKRNSARYKWLRSQAATTLSCIAYRVPKALEIRANDPDKCIDIAMENSNEA